MELIKYQKRCIDDLKDFINMTNSVDSVADAYEMYWKKRNIRVGINGVPKYNDEVKNVPHVCLKIPTGGGKTFIACHAIKTIFDNYEKHGKKFVVWLVPSESILEQTLKNLKDVNHPYRQVINSSFNNSVEIYTKEELLNGQNFNISSIEEQLGIAVLTFDSFRITNKEGRRIYQENSNFQQFVNYYDNKESLVSNVNETALIQVINQLKPLVIVDESHNAVSDLSIEMLKNINPSFVIDLTATPRENSNIIVYVDAIVLKKENMVKLPVIVYNRPDYKNVIVDAIDLRNKLEKQAIEEEIQKNNIQPGSGKYIRPIVLFQAQPKNNKDNTTFEKIKENLISVRNTK